MPPITPHVVAGKVYDIYGNILSSADVTLTHESIEPVLSTTSNSSGEFAFNLSSLGEQWEAGEEITLEATKDYEGIVSTTVDITSGGGQTHNLTLGVETDFDFERSTDTPDRYGFTMSMLTTFDGNKVSPLNPMPVENTNLLERYRVADQDISSSTSYFGFTDRTGNWYILKQTNSNPQTFRYIKGSSDYVTNWGDRSNLTYGYFHDVF